MSPFKKGGIKGGFNILFYSKNKLNSFILFYPTKTILATFFNYPMRCLATY